MPGNNFKRASLLSIALLAVLTTACEKKNKKVNLAFGIVPKEQNAPVPVGPAQQPTVTVAPPKPNPTPTPAPDKEQDKSGGGSTNPNTDKNPDTNTDPDRKPKPEGGGEIGGEGGRGSQENIIDGKDDDAILKPTIDKHNTGGAISQGLIYTGSAEDNLLPYLKKRADTASAVSRERNKAFAKQIENASIEFKEDETEARVSLTIKGPMTRGKAQTLVLGGAVAPNAGSEMKLSREQGRLFPNLTAKLYCVDLDGSCESSFIRITNGVPGERAIVSIVLRATQANSYVNFPKKDFSSREFDIFSRYIWNTSSGFNEPNKFEAVFFNSFEVVNGKSGFRTTLVARDAEVLSFGAELLAPENGTAVSLPVDRTVPDFVKELLGGQDVQNNLANMISDVRFVNNNGRGRVRLSIRLKNSPKGKDGQFLFTFVRDVKPLMKLSDESLGLE